MSRKLRWSKKRSASAVAVAELGECLVEQRGDAGPGGVGLGAMEQGVHDFFFTMLPPYLAAQGVGGDETRGAQQPA